jgi:hypothetical protein
LSLNRLTTSAVRKQVADKLDAEDRAGAQEAAAPVSPTAIEDRDGALSTLVRFIPTESITLYIAFVGIAPAIQQGASRSVATVAYWSFGLFVTPLIFVLMVATKRKAAGMSDLLTLTGWPWFDFAAAILSFLTWALAVPNHPYVTSDPMRAVVSFSVLIVSTLLTALQKLFGNPPPMAPSTEP